MPPVDNPQPGRSVVYYTGESLARARQSAPVEAADSTWQLTLAGKVDLLQRKLADGQIAYLAVGRRRLDKNPVRAMITVTYKPRKAVA